MPTFQNLSSQKESELEKENIEGKDDHSDVKEDANEESEIKDSSIDDSKSSEDYKQDKHEETSSETQMESCQTTSAMIKDEDGRTSLPSLKSTLKDRSKSAANVERQHKMQLLVEILRLLQIYKAHSVKNKFHQWAMVQDALEKQDTGSLYKRMDKSYCFRKKVLNAVNSWIDWAKARGYPDPESLRGHPCTTWRFPAFLELLYKTYLEIKDAEKNKENGSGYYSDEKKDDEESFKKTSEIKNDEPVSPKLTMNTSPDEHPKKDNSQPKPSNSRLCDVDDDIDDSVPVTSVIQAVNSHAAIAATGGNSSSSLNNYLKMVTLVQKEKANILSLKRSALQAELDDLDLLRLEKIEGKLSKFKSGSDLLTQYSKQKDRCISRLERR